MRGLHPGAARRAVAGRIAIGAAFALALGACTLTPWRTADTGETEPTVDTSATATAVAPPAIGASALPAAGTATDASPGFYRVKPGDTLYHVAKAHGQRAADLASWNKLPADAKIQTGQLLRVAPPAVGAAAAPVAPVASAPSAASAPKAIVPGTAAASPPAAHRNARFIWPIEGSVAQPFNAKSKGVVIAGPAGQQVKASASGRVVYAGSGIKAYGKLVIVKHDSHLLTVYGRNGKLLVKEGDAVKQGQAIAESGTDATGKASLVFELREDGKPVDPLGQLPKAQP